MKKIRIALKNIAILIVLISSFIACDKDFASIDSDIVNNDNATHFGTDSRDFSVITYNKKLEPVQTNNLPVNLLGIYNDAIYGKTTSTFVTQVNSSLLDPDFGDNVVLDSVVLTIPYFSTAVGTDIDGNTEYELDSVFGDEPIKLSIYESNYFLRNFDPSSEFNTTQRYFSNASTSSSDFIDQSELEATLLNTVANPNGPDLNNFNPSSSQIVLTEPEDENGVKEVIERQAPALRIKLDNAFWQDKILDKEGEPELSNQNNFNNYFRGLYFKAEPVGAEGNLTLLNLASVGANITMYYTKDPFTEGDDAVQSTYVLSFSGNRANFFVNDYNFPLQDGDEVDGDEKLFLKGGEGSMAIVNLFNGDEDGNSTELDEFRANNWLINEANLVFYVDQTQPLTQEPDKIYLYDLNNKTPLVDYYLDLTNGTNPINSKPNHLGLLQRDEVTNEGIRYKLRITEHINNILLKDSTNVKLGLVVSGNVNLENNTLQYSLLTDNENLNKIPGSSIISPRGTILYGNNTSNEEKKVYLEIFYTEPNN
jgi:hypothetical protein